MTTDDQPLREALKRVASTLKAADIPFALSGGYAVWARGGPEPEHDVDFLVCEEDVPGVERVLEEAGLRIEQPPEDWLTKAYDGPHLVDLIFRPVQRPVTREQLERTDDISVDSVLMPVARATDIFVGKLLALDERSCDFSNLFAQVRALREQVDWHALHAEVGESPFARAFLGCCADLGLAPAVDRA